MDPHGELLRFQNGEPVTDSIQWPARQKEIRKVLEKYMFGDWPLPPEKTAIKYQDPKGINKGYYIQQGVQLFFAPSLKAVNYIDKNFAYGKVDYSTFIVATLNAELYIPRGKGPFPAIIELGPSRDQISEQDSERVRRGYIVCRYNRKDADLIPAVYADFTCNQIEWWAYAASRCVDMLYSRNDVDKSAIVVAGHSRL